MDKYEMLDVIDDKIKDIHKRVKFLQESSKELFESLQMIDKLNHEYRLILQEGI